MNLQKKSKRTEYSEKMIMDNLENTKYEMSHMDICLDYITEPIIMNQIIFQRKAAEMRYRYWLRLAREKKNSANVTK